MVQDLPSIRKASSGKDWNEQDPSPRSLRLWPCARCVSVKSNLAYQLLRSRPCICRIGNGVVATSHPSDDHG